MKMKLFLKKHSWILLFVSLFILDAIWFINSDFSDSRSIVIKLKNSNSSMVSLFENSYYKVLKPINIEGDGKFKLETSKHYLALIKTNNSNNNQCFITIKTSNKLIYYNINYHGNPNINEIKLIPCNDLFWFLIENKHNFYKINIIILLFVFVYFLTGDNL